MESKVIIVSAPLNCKNQPIQSDKIKRAARYNYSDMKEETAEAHKGFAQTLAALRTIKGISAREMSLSLGQSASYINDIENGRALPSLAMFFEVCEYLGVSPMEFFQYADDLNRDTAIEIVGIMNKLSKRDQILLLKIAERMQQNR